MSDTFVHADKIRHLLRSNDNLQKEIEKLKSEGKDNVRVKIIKSLRLSLLESQALAEELKTLALSSGASQQQIIAAHDKVNDGIKRTRPPNVDELKQQIAELKLENVKLTRKLANRDAVEYPGFKAILSSDKTALSSAPFRIPQSEMALTLPELDQETTQRIEDVRKKYVIRKQDPVSHQLFLALVALEQQERSQHLHEEMIAEANDQIQALQRFKLKCQDLENEKADLASELKVVQKELLKAVADDEQMFQEIRLLKSQATSLSALNQRLQNKIESMTR